MPDASPMFDLSGKVAVVTGGGGDLGGAIAAGYAQAGASVVVTDIREGQAELVAEQIAKKYGVTAKGYLVDVLSDDGVPNFCDQVYADFGQVDILVNCVGGNMKGATTSDEQSFFDLPTDALKMVLDLNFTMGTVKPSQVFGKRMVASENGGSIINISSMTALRPLTRVFGYCASKAAVSNFTQWLAVHIAQEHSKKVRVNAIAPGFFLTNQNRFLLTDEETGDLTARGQQIIDHTPIGKFGAPDDLVSTALWLASDASHMVTGTIIPVDGGFSAFSGV